MIVAGTLELAVGFYIASSMAPIFTQAAVNAGFEMPEGAVQITSIGDGFLWTSWLFTNLPEWLGGALGVVVLLVLLALVMFLYNRNRDAWERIAGAPVEE
jgi:PTS system galactitol-specific IIC component